MLGAAKSDASVGPGRGRAPAKVMLLTASSKLHWAHLQRRLLHKNMRRIPETHVTQQCMRTYLLLLHAGLRSEMSTCPIMTDSACMHLQLEPDQQRYGINDIRVGHTQSALPRKPYQEG